MTDAQISRRAFLAGTTAAVLTTGAGLGRAGADPTGQTRINVAGFQRTLCQMIPVGAAFAKLGIERTRHLAQVEDSRAQFAIVLDALRSGSDEIGLAPEENPRVLESLGSVEGLWAPFDAAARAIAEAGEVTDDAFGTIVALNGPLLQTSDNVVSQIVSAYGGTALPVGIAISINIAGRQRTRIQEIAKDIALIGLDLDRAGRLAALESDAALLDESLNALVSGLDDIALPPPPDHIRLKLLEVQSGWKAFKATVDTVLANGEAGPAELYAAAAQTNPLMHRMDEAVGLYTRL